MGPCPQARLYWAGRTMGWMADWTRLDEKAHYLRVPHFIWASCTQHESSCRIEVTSRLFYRLIVNPDKAPLPDPFGRDSLRQIRQIHQSHTRGRANSSPWLWRLWGELWWVDDVDVFYSYIDKPTWREFFVPSQTLIEVKLAANVERWKSYLYSAY